MIPVRVPPHSRRRIETGPASARDYRAVYAITRPCIFQPNELFDIVRSAGLRLSAGASALKKAAALLINEPSLASMPGRGGTHALRPLDVTTCGPATSAEDAWCSHEACPARHSPHILSTTGTLAAGVSRVYRGLPYPLRRDGQGW